MSLLSQNFDQMKRALYMKAALADDGKSRVSAQTIRAGLLKALDSADLALNAQSSGAVGVHVPVNLLVTNDAGEQFVLSGQVLLQVPETRKAREPKAGRVLTVADAPVAAVPTPRDLVHVPSV